MRPLKTGPPAASTVRSKLAFAVSEKLFVTVTSYDADGAALVGVPLMAQVVALRVSPSGRLGVTVQSVIVAPSPAETVGSRLAGDPTVRVKGAPA